MPNLNYVPRSVLNSLWIILFPSQLQKVKQHCTDEKTQLIKNERGEGHRAGELWGRNSSLGCLNPEPVLLATAPTVLPACAPQV
jgi:hypothetical protein